MTDSESSKSKAKANAEAAAAAPDDEVAAGVAAETEGDVETTPEPEPWTPARVLEWNAYYDFYVAIGVLLLGFLASANFVNYSQLWTQLRLGRQIIEQGAPVATDPFSYTEAGRAWVNIPWLFEVAHAGVFNLASSVIAKDPTDPATSAARADQIGVGTLVALNAAARLFTILCILLMRRRGPGLWWAAICATLALGAIFSPMGLSMGGFGVGLLLGGIATPALVSPQTWGQLLLAIALLCLHWTVNLRKRNAILALVPLFLVWANVDESFLAGYVLLAAAILGEAISARREAEPAITPLRAVGVLLASAAACCLNPSHVKVFLAAIDSSDQLSFFGSTLAKLRPAGGGGDYLVLRANYLLLVGIGMFSFVLNSKRFRLGRFLMFVVASLMWGLFIRFGAEFALAFAVTLILNGQEWFQARYGSEGRLGRGWAIWSVGGRAVTIVAIFAAIALALTGYGRGGGEARFGFGFNPDDFAFEAADFLRDAKFDGNILNTTAAQGDALIWRAAPSRKVFVDSRRNFYPAKLYEELNKLRLALRDDDVAVWKPLLDQYKVSVVLVEATSFAPKTYEKLKTSKAWIPFYDDGQVVAFGRADAAAGDVAYFKERRLDADALAYPRPSPTPTFDRPPAPVNALDAIFQNRVNVRPQPHTEAARRWLQTASPDSTEVVPPDPAHCLLAVREARIALSKNPDDSRAYRILAEAYQLLMVEESGLIAGLSLDPASIAKTLRVQPRPSLLMNRVRQRMTALNYAIATSPPPRNDLERGELQALNLQLFDLCLSINFIDLARDRLQWVLDNAQGGDLNVDSRAQLADQLRQLDERVNQIQTAMQDATIERQANAVQRAFIALNNGAPGLAIKEFEEAEQTGVSPAVVKPNLLDLYCDTGQPDKAAELLRAGNVDDPELETEAGLSAIRQGRVNFLLGNYENAASLWRERGLPRLRMERGMKAPSATVNFLRGGLKAATSSFMALPPKIGTEALWEFDLGMCLLEGGSAKEAADALTRALVLEPDLPMRPVIAYYLGKLGKPVPPRRNADAKPEVPSLPGLPNLLNPAGVANPAAPASPLEKLKP